MATLLRPRSIAIVGISARGGFATTVARNLDAHGFRADVHLVNPHRGELDGRPCHPSVQAIPADVDLALVFVPAAAVPSVVDDCGRAGVRFAIVYSSNFAEAGPDGAALQERVARIARSWGMRILGPNCQGLFYAPTQLAAAFTPSLDGERPPPSGIAYVGQSGAIGGAVMSLAAERGLGLTAWASVGNQVDLTATELAEHLLDEPDVRLVALYLETVPDGGAWDRLTRRAVDHGKRIVLLRSGRSAEGRRAAASHTGAMVRPDAAFDLLGRARGVIEVADVDDMIDTIQGLTLDGRSAGPEVAVVTSSGGAGSLIADHLDGTSLRLAALGPTTRATLTTLIPAYGSAANPIDVTAQLFAHRGDGAFERVCRAVADDDRVDVALVVLTGAAGELAAWVAGSVARVAASADTRFVVAWMVPAGDISEAARILRDAGVFLTGSIGAAVRLVERLQPSPAELRDGPPIGFSDTLLAGQLTTPGVLTEAAASAVLDALGIDRPAARLVRSTAEAVRATEELDGDTFAFKIQSPQIPHKSEIGGVRLGVRPETATTAFAEVLCSADAVPGAQVEGVLVQSMVPASDEAVELIIGVQGAQDGYPPVVTVGLGGVTAELYGDVASATAPLGPARALDLLRSLTCWPLLDGYRGRPRLAVEQAVHALTAASGAACDLGERLGEFEINPLRVDRHAATALDLLIRVDETPGGA